MRLLRRLAYYLATIMVVTFVASALDAHAAAPSGNDWYQLLASPFTGGDNTGDGGTGLPADLNYFYVGQSFVSTMQINVDTLAGSNAANIWIDYPTTTVSASSLTTGSFFPIWSGQVVSSSIGRVYSTGFRTSGYATGQGSFGTVTWTMLKPTNAAYGTSSPALLDINIGTVGNTTESNISNNGTDLLDDAEDFSMHVWADTIKPYALNPVPVNAASAVAIDANYTFDLRDSKNGEGDNSGVGTGVNTTEPPGAITTNDGGGPVSVVAFDAFSCSGVWGTNLCGVTVNPPPPSGFAGDTRNWAYSTTYTVAITGFQDLASASQNQLGDANGPNTMDPKAFTFTTEADTVAPRVTSETPVRLSSGNSPSTNLIITVQDRKTYPAGPSGTGVSSTTCLINVSSPSFALTTYQQGDSGVTVTPIDYGYTFTINPATDFAQNETVSVSAYDCEDLAGNTMTTDNWTFSTADSADPYVTGESPSNDQTASTTQNAIFHIKDDGSGVDLANTVIFFNGVYYTNAGGAGSVTNVGTKINFTSSLNFNGGNYVGDTTSRTGTSTDYTFTIDPQADYSPGEAVPVIIYTRDLSGNLMERVVYAFVAEGVSTSCPAGSSFCGTGTTWNGSQCVATGGGGGGGGSCTPGGGGGLPAIALEVNEPTVSVFQIDETSVLITWATNKPASSMVVYDSRPSTDGTPPRFGYPNATPEAFVTSTYHSVQVNGLQPGIIYYFRPVSRYYNETGAGMERQFLTTTANQITNTVYLPGKNTTTTITVTSPAPAPVCPIPTTQSPQNTTTTITNTIPGQTVYVPSETVQWLERVRSYIPPEWGYALIGLAFLMALAVLLLLRMHNPRHAALAIVLGILILVTAAMGALILNREMSPTGMPTASGKQIDVRGGVIAPFNAAAISGIDLTVGDTSIRTSTGGQFAFPNAHVGERMRINHPLLKRPMYWQLSESSGPMVLLFDVDLYNALPASVTAITGIDLDQARQIAHVDVLQGSAKQTFSIVWNGSAWSPVK